MTCKESFSCKDCIWRDQCEDEDICDHFYPTKDTENIYENIIDIKEKEDFSYNWIEYLRDRELDINLIKEVKKGVLGNRS